MVRLVTDDDIGLRVLREASVEAAQTVDIVAVHGIGAHPDDSWCKDVGTVESPRWVNWLVEEGMLPAVAPSARIMRYGYQSQWFGEGAMRQSASTVAQRLLLALRRKRDDHPFRPLIFIAHCFGGLVVLKVLLEARQEESEWLGIFASTTGLVFLGTPFRGAEGMSQMEMLEAARREYQEDEVQPAVLRILEPGNEFLREVVDQFGKTRRQENKAHVACFYELKSSNVGRIVGRQDRMRFVVSESSGCLDLSDLTSKFSLSRTHFDMNKFGKPTDEDFETMTDVIKEMIAISHELVLARFPSIVGRTPNHLVATLLNSFHQSKIAMPTDRYRNFRLRGIPFECQSRAEVRELVKGIFSINSGASFVVHSLATNPIDNHSKVSTLTFNDIPACLSDECKTEWVFNVPTSELYNRESFSQGISLVFDTHFSGFTPLQHTRDDDCSVDVIALSGLGRHVLDYFKERDGPFLWLRDALPLDLPGARILIYGYNAQPLRNCSVQNLTDLGRTLQIDIEGIRETRQSRPMVFIGHSLGGVVIKEALVKAKEEMEEQGTSLLNNITGFLFFGVPHQGMAMGSLIPLVEDHSNLSLLESLNENSPLLPRLENDFKNAFGTSHPRIVSFYETEKSATALRSKDDRWELTGPLKILVDPSSATYGSKHQHPIDRKHSELVQYNNQYDSIYIRVKIALVSLVSSGQSGNVVGSREEGHCPSSPLSDKELECLRSLSFREQDHRYNNIHSEKGTCEWLLEDRQYQAWLKKPQGLFWVKGNPGAGKSVLMKFAVTMMDHRKSGEIVLSFFIHGRGTLLQKTPLGVFRALLNSMLKYFPHYLSQLTERFEDQEKRFGSYGENRWDWAQKELQDFTSKVITKGTQNRPVAIFVDALDECGRDFAKELLTYFKDLFEEIKREGAQVKICLSSRHYPILGHDTIPTVSVEERNDKDIRLVIQRRLREIEPATKRQRIEKDILLKAQGGFQWAVLVSDMVTDENITGMKAEKLHEKLASIPEHLDELYTDILGGSTAIENNQMTRLFQWILFSERPLSAQELRDALATDKDMTYTSVSEFRSHEVWIDDIAQFERRIKHISRGLVEFQTREFWEQYELGGEDSNREVQFIHQSVADYMLNKFLNNVEHHYGTPQAQTGAGHFQISRSCLKYLTIEEVLQAHQLSRGKLSARFPLAPYATRFIFDHIRKVEQEGIPQLDLLSLIQWKPQSEPLRNLASLWRILDPNSAHAPMGWPFVGATALHALIAFGSKSAFDTFLQRNDVEVDGRDSDGNTPLLLAIREGHQGMALALINYSIERTSSWSTSQGDENARGVSRIVDIDAENDHGETPLTVALTEKAGEVIFKLVDAGAALKLFGRETALLYYTIRERNEKLLMKLIEKNILLDGGVYFALKEFSNGEDKVLENFIQLLLEAGGNRSKSTEFDEYDHEEDYDEDYDEDDEYLDDAALFWASRRGQGAIVNLLLSHGASADSQNTMGDLPLHLALKKNHEVVVGILIREAPLTADIGDKNGQTPLELAVDAGNEAIVKLLLTKELLNIDKTIPLRIAIHDGHTAVIELFLATKRFDVNIKDFNERPLLLWAVETENEAAVKQLLATEQIDVNAMNSDRWTPLMHAIEYEKECMVKLLLATRKANINLEYPDGQTLLSRATRTSNKAITLALLSTGKFNVNARDSDGHTLLSRAAKTGNETVVELLLATAKVKVDAKDRDGQTPLAWAVWNAHTVIFKLLLATGKVNINAKYHNGQTLLSRAVEKSNEVIAQALLATGKFDVNVWGVYGQTLLSRAAETKNETMVKMLLATEQVDVDAKDIDGWTPLAWAVQNGYSGIVRLLLETRKVNVNVRDANGQTLLSLASMDGRISMVRLFLESEQVEVDAEDAKGGTPLAWAVQNGYSGIVKLLLETGKVNVNARDANKRTPLSLASENGNESIVELLLSTEQIDIDVEDAEGWTALAWAVQNGRSGIVRLLLETGKVNANARDANKRTLLSLASENGDEPIVKLFLAAEQVEVDAEDTYGWTPLAWAVENGYCGIVRLLLETGKVNINLRDTDGQTLLSRAVENGDELIAELLLATSAIEADA